MTMRVLFSRRHAEVKIVLITLSILILLPIICVVVFASSGLALVSNALVAVNPETKRVELFDPNGNKVQELSLITVWPTKGYISDVFGSHDAVRQNMQLGPHTGIDIANESGIEGELVTPFMPGKVIAVNPIDNNACGIFVKIQHDYGLTSLYCHLRSVTTIYQQPVKPGDVIGLMGNSGASTGAHLHFQVNLYDIPINPQTFLVGRPERSTVRAVLPSF